MDVLLGKGPSARHELFYFGGPQLGALRIDDFKFQFFQQPYGWPGEKVTTDMPTIINIRQDPFERTPSIRGESLERSRRRLHERLLCRASSGASCSCSRRWRSSRKTAIEFPPMQAPASFNLEAVKNQVEEIIKAHEGQ